MAAIRLWCNLMAAKKGDFAKDVVFTPAEASNLALQCVKDRRDNPHLGVPLYLSNVDEYFVRMRPGELITVIGRPGNYKSGLMQWIARNEAARLVREGRDSKEYVAYITWEQSVEDMAIIELAHDTRENVTHLAQGMVSDFDKLIGAAVRRGALPLWIIGHSSQSNRRRPRLTMTNVGEALLFIESEWDMKPSLIILDYLQRIAAEGGNDIRQQTIINVDRSKDMAFAMGCPVMLGTQARREVDDRKVPIPGMRDSAESANAEHSSDGILTTWFARTTHSGQTIPTECRICGGMSVTEDMLFISVAKRKLGPFGEMFLVSADPTRNIIKPMEIRTLSLS